MTQAWDFVDASILWQSRSEFLNVPVDRIDWGDDNVRIRNALKNDEIATVADLVAKTRHELLRTPNFGRISLRKIEAVLGEHGLELAQF